MIRCRRKGGSDSRAKRERVSGTATTHGGRHVTECTRASSRERATSGARRAHVTQYTTFFS